MKTPAADTSKADEISQLEKSLASLEAEKERQISSFKQQLGSLKAQNSSDLCHVSARVWLPPAMLRAA